MEKKLTVVCIVIIVLALIACLWAYLQPGKEQEAAEPGLTIVAAPEQS